MVKEVRYGSIGESGGKSMTPNQHIYIWLKCACRQFWRVREIGEKVDNMKGKYAN